MLKEANFNIIGHADLVRKNNEKLCMFNENDSWYREEIKITADEIKKAGVIAEINTGAIARGTMDDVYPSAEFLSLLRERSVPVTINTDCHSPDKIDCGYERALQAALKAGYSELAYIDRNKFEKLLTNEFAHLMDDEDIDTIKAENVCSSVGKEDKNAVYNFRNPRNNCGPSRNCRYPNPYDKSAGHRRMQNRNFRRGNRNRRKKTRRYGKSSNRFQKRGRGPFPVL